MDTSVLEALVAAVKNETNVAARVRALAALHKQIAEVVNELLIISAEGLEEEDAA